MNEKAAEFRQCRIKSLESVTLERLLDKNLPLLLRAKKGSPASRLVEGLLDNFLSLPEERFLEDLLRDLAVSIMNKTHGGHRSPTADADLEFISDGINHIISAEPDIIELISDMTTEDETSHNEKSRLINRLTKQFIDRFCDNRGTIDWVKLVKASSGNQ